MNLLVGAASIFAVIGAGVYQIYLKAPIESLALFGRDINPLNNENCRIVEALPACEKVVLHAPTGLLFAACSTPESRVAWCPALEFLNASGRAEDWVGIYDPVKSSLRKLKMSGFNDPRGYNSHGMDVVPSSKNPSELFVYLVNQRPPLDGIASQKVERPNPSVEIFKMSSINSDVLEHVRTVEHPLVIAPNDVVGSSDGKEFWATNDGSHTRGLATHIRVWFQTKDTSVTHCSVTEDGMTNCKIAIDNLAGANGIAREPGTDKFYIPDQIMPRVSVFERQADNTLVLSDEIKLLYPSDNVAVDQDGALWAASSPLAAHRSLKHFRHPEITTPSASTRVTINTGKSSFFGEKYKVQLVFEDGGLIASGATTTVYDAERGRLFLSGLSAPATVCDLPKEKFDVESLAAAAAAN